MCSRFSCSRLAPGAQRLPAGKMKQEARCAEVGAALRPGRRARPAAPPAAGRLRSEKRRYEQRFLFGVRKMASPAFDQPRSEIRCSPAAPDPSVLLRKKPASRRLLQGPFFCPRAVPGGQASEEQGPELRPQVHPDAGRWAMASYYGGYPHGVSSRSPFLSKTPSRRLL